MVESGETEKLKDEPKMQDSSTSMSQERLTLMISHNQVGSLSSLWRGSKASFESFKLKVEIRQLKLKPFDQQAYFGTSTLLDGYSTSKQQLNEPQRWQCFKGKMRIRNFMTLLQLKIILDRLAKVCIRDQSHKNINSNYEKRRERL